MTAIPALRAIDVLYVLSTAVPDGMNLHLSRLLFNNGQVTVSGTTDSFNTVDRLKNALENPMSSNRHHQHSRCRQRRKPDHLSVQNRDMIP